MAEYDKCPWCNGTGRVQSQRHGEVQCGDCLGSGRFIGGVPDIAALRADLERVTGERDAARKERIEAIRDATRLRTDIGHLQTQLADLKKYKQDATDAILKLRDERDAAQRQLDTLAGLPESDKKQLSDFKAFLGMPEANIRNMAQLKAERDAAVAEVGRLRTAMEQIGEVFVVDINPGVRFCRACLDTVQTCEDRVASGVRGCEGHAARAALNPPTGGQEE